MQVQVNTQQEQSTNVPGGIVARVEYAHNEVSHLWC